VGLRMRALSSACRCVSPNPDAGGCRAGHRRQARVERNIKPTTASGASTTPQITTVGDHSYTAPDLRRLHQRHRYEGLREHVF
jgi:hypothetical protein